MNDTASPEPPEQGPWAGLAQRTAAGKVTFGDLVTLWVNLEEADDPEIIRAGRELYDRAVAVFTESKEESGVEGEVRFAIFGVGCGVYLTPDGQLDEVIFESAIGFDWIAAYGLLSRAQRIAIRSHELWGANPTLLLGPASNKQRLANKEVSERIPHCRRAYELCTSVFSAVNMEKLHRDAEREGGKQLSEEPSKKFHERVAVIEPRINEAEADFERAAQRYAQSRYGKGMILGIVAVGMICGVMAIAFGAHHVPAWYGVAVLAGGVGATVSVLQRMASNKLHLEYDAGRGTLLTLGAVRPLIGAIFGLVLFCAINGGWIPAIEVSTGDALGFYAVLGFLAGFNERFAQDMLVISASRVSSKASAANDEDPSNGATSTPKPETMTA
jgi:hypothetical protein